MDSHEEAISKSGVENALHSDKVDYATLTIGRTVQVPRIEKKNERDGMNDVTIKYDTGSVTVVLFGPNTIIKDTPM